MAEGLPFQQESSRWQDFFLAKDRFQITVRQVKVARFAGEYVYLQIHGLTPFRTRATGKNSTGRVSTFCVRRHAKRIQSQARERVQPRLPVSLPTFKNTVSFHLELVQEEKAASNVLSFNFAVSLNFEPV